MKKRRKDRHARKSAKIELSPLENHELELCLKLLSTELHEAAQCRDLVDVVRKELLATPRPYFLKSAPTDPTAKSPGWLAWESAAEEHLRAAQSDWRSKARGPEEMVIGAATGADFDNHLLEPSTAGFKMPVLHFGLMRVGDKSGQGFEFSPTVAVSIGNFHDLFNWFLIRAVANRQVSRFAHCVVCGRWELRKFAGRRSQAKFQYARTHGDRSKWNDLIWSLPVWPAVCGKKGCKSRYQNVVGELSAFNVKDFLGLQRKGITQFLYKKLPKRQRA